MGELRLSPSRLRKEGDALAGLPYARHASDHIVTLDSGALMIAFQLQGAAFETADPRDLNDWHVKLNQTWRNLADDRHRKLFPQPAEKRRYDVNRTGEFTAPGGAGRNHGGARGILFQGIGGIDQGGFGHGFAGGMLAAGSWLGRRLGYHRRSVSLSRPSASP